MPRSFAFALRSIVLLMAVSSSLACTEPPRLNVIVITLDTTRADALGAYGQSKPVSPRIDAMAADGVLFEDVVTSAPSTLPSHVTIFTGKQPYAHGVRANAGFRLAAEHVTLAERLREAGWATRAEIAASVLGRNKQLDQGFDDYRDPGTEMPVIDAITREDRFARLTRSAEVITAEGLDYVRENAERPFFLWLHYFDPHKPYAPPEEFKAGLADYHAEVRRVDHHVGRLLDEIESLGLRDRTLVVLTSDHGEGQEQHGEETHSYFVYESTMRVPLIFWGAQVPRGVRVPALARTVDVTPTLLDLLGQPPLEGVQGESLTPLFSNPAGNLNLIGYGESIESTLAFGSSVLRFVRVGRWKYIHKVNPELYDVDSDPTEVRNRFAERVAKRERLQRRLAELLEEASASDASSRMQLDAEQIAELRALGYVGEVADADQAASFDSLELIGPDPNDHVRDVQLFAHAYGFLERGELDEALAVADELLQRQPNSHMGHTIRVRALRRLGRAEDLEPALRAALEVTPDSTEHLTELGALLMGQKQYAEAESLMRRALEVNPCGSRARLLLATLFDEIARPREQYALLSEIEPTCTGQEPLRNALAFLLATSSDAGLRDGARALAIARELVEADGGTHPGTLDTLAAAYAETGDFERAIAEQERAMRLLEGRELPEGVYETFERHLAAYREGRPARARAR